MEFHQFLRGRRSVLRFKPQAVPDSAIERMLATAAFAPSAHHREPWRFVVLKSPESRTWLADAMGADLRRDLAADGLPEEEIDKQVGRSRQRLLAAPGVIVLCMDSSEINAHPNERRATAERMMAVQSVAAASLQLLLAAHAEGLGGVWVCSPLFVPETVQESLDLPESWEPQAMFYIGYPTEIPEAGPRKPLEVTKVER